MTGLFLLLSACQYDRAACLVDGPRIRPDRESSLGFSADDILEVLDAGTPWTVTWTRHPEREGEWSEGYDATWSIGRGPIRDAVLTQNTRTYWEWECREGNALVVPLELELRSQDREWTFDGDGEGGAVAYALDDVEIVAVAPATGDRVASYAEESSYPEYDLSIQVTGGPEGGDLGVTLRDYGEFGAYRCCPGEGLWAPAE